MKKSVLFPAFTAFIGILIAIMPLFLVGDCSKAMGMCCGGTARVELVIGLMIFALAILSMFFPAAQTKLGIFLSLIGFGVLSGLVSTILIGFCNGDCPNPNCNCHPLTTIIMVVLSALAVIGSGLSMVSTKDA